MDEVLCIFYTIEMLRMLENLHKVGLIHGDFKPDNLLVRCSRSSPHQPTFLVWKILFIFVSRNMYSLRLEIVYSFSVVIALRMDTLFPNGGSIRLHSFRILKLNQNKVVFGIKMQYGCKQEDYIVVSWFCSEYLGGWAPDKPGSWKQQVRASRQLSRLTSLLLKWVLKLLVAWIWAVCLVVHYTILKRAVHL